MVGVGFGIPTPGRYQGSVHVLIVGAGITGLTAARRILDAGGTVTVVDKSMAVGGRMATRRVKDARFDHGAQHFGVIHDDFAREIDALTKLGVVKVWFDGKPADSRPNPRYVGTPSMRSICEELAVDLGVRLGMKIDRVNRDGGALEVVAGDGEILEADAVIVTAPLPQAIGMLDSFDLGAVGRWLETIDYDPCLVGLVIPEEPVEIPQGHIASDSSSVAWIADNQQKGVSHVPALTIHSTTRFAMDHLEEPTEQWLPILVTKAERITGCKATAAVGHRWRYSVPRKPLEAGAVEIAPSVIIAGEALSSARIEGGFTSGLAAAALLTG